MREIKFRAWNEARSMMILPEELGLLDGEVSKQAEGAGNIIEQSTGLTDINGKAIFEGDVVESDTINGPESFVIRWYEDKATFGADIIGSNDWFMVYDFDFTVIGNIHEHSHLLEV